VTVNAPITHDGSGYVIDAVSGSIVIGRALEGGAAGRTSSRCNCNRPSAGATSPSRPVTSQQEKTHDPILRRPRRRMSTRSCASGHHAARRAGALPAVRDGSRCRAPVPGGIARSPGPALHARAVPDRVRRPHRRAALEPRHCGVLGGNLVGEALFPPVPVDKRSNKYYTITKADWLRLPDTTLRAEGVAPSRRVVGLERCLLRAELRAGGRGDEGKPRQRRRRDAHSRAQRDAGDQHAAP
jgi:hypothetical protein